MAVQRKRNGKKKRKKRNSEYKWERKKVRKVRAKVRRKKSKQNLCKSLTLFSNDIFCSLLLPSYQKEFVENALNDIWKLRIQQKPKQWLLFVFEEFQLYAKNIRGNVSQNILRIMCGS